MWVKEQNLEHPWRCNDTCDLLRIGNDTHVGLVRDKENWTQEGVVEGFGVIAKGEGLSWWRWWRELLGTCRRSLLFIIPSFKVKARRIGPSRISFRPFFFFLLAGATDHLEGHEKGQFTVKALWPAIIINVRRRCVPITIVYRLYTWYSTSLEKVIQTEYFGRNVNHPFSSERKHKIGESR